MRFFVYTAAVFARMAALYPSVTVIPTQDKLLKRLIPLLFVLLIAIWVIVAVVVISRVPAP